MAVGQELVELARQFRAQGRDPMQTPVVKNSGLDSFLDDLAIQLAHANLVRKELGLGKTEDIGGEMLKMWVIERRKNVAVVLGCRHA